MSEVLTSSQDNEVSTQLPVPQMHPDDPHLLFCICRKPQGRKFMISCDNCDEWFHGKCVRMTKLKNDELITNNESWYCPLCIGSVPTDVSQVDIATIADSQDEIVTPPILSRAAQASSITADEIIRADESIILPVLHPEDFINSTTPSSNQGPKDTPCLICHKSYRGIIGLKQHMRLKHREQLPPPEDITEPTALAYHLYLLKSRITVLKRVPKGARRAVAEELHSLTSSCVNDNSPSDWIRLFIFPYAVLQVPDKQNKKSKSLASAVKANLDIWRKRRSLAPYFLFKSYVEECKPRKVSKKKDKTNQLPKRIESKLSDGDVRGAIRLLCSEDSLAQIDEMTFKRLQAKHPEALDDIGVEDFPGKTFQNPPVHATEVLKAILSFPAGSAGGMDSLRPQHLKDLTTTELGPTSTNLLSSLADLCDLCFNGLVPLDIMPIVYGASLCALNKKDGGIRPIAVGCTLRRLVAKVGCHRISDSLGQKLRPTQLGFGTKSGAEAGAHSARRYLSFNHDSPKVLLKIDYFNAFNMISRNGLLSLVKDRLPHLYPFIKQCYQNPTILSYGDYQIFSKRGVQQGDPLGPALFCLALQDLTTSLKSELNVWYLDDGAIGDSPITVLEDLRSIISSSIEIGLTLNPSKCELIILSDDPDVRSNILKEFNFIAPGITLINRKDASLLGCPLSDSGISLALQTKTEVLKRFTGRLADLSSHSAFFLLKNSLAIPRLTYLLRCSPCWRSPEDLTSYDNFLRKAMEQLTNCKMDNLSWSQTTLPVRLGGLGLRDTTSLCYSAFLGSAHGVSELVQSILPASIVCLPDETLVEAIELWKNICQKDPILNPLSHSQRQWDLVVCQNTLDTLTTQAKDLNMKARLLAIQAKESGAWLNALPSPCLGTLLENSTFRIAVALRIGQPLCESHKCTCGETVDIMGYHGLSCRKSTGRRSRHENINDIIKRALVSAEFPAIREPVGCCRSDGKRPDGMTLVPWKGGKSLLWDATCSDTMAESYLSLTSKKYGEAARLAEDRKRAKYQELESRFVFIPFAVETFGPWGSEAKSFIRCIGKLIRGVTNEKKSTSYLIQRISLAIQRGNAASIMGTIPYSDCLDEIFYI